MEIVTNLLLIAIFMFGLFIIGSILVLGIQRLLEITVIGLPKKLKTIVIRLLKEVKKAVWRPTSLGIGYILFGILIFMRPPQYIHSNIYHYVKPDKFVWIWNSDKVDYYLFSFEIIGFILLGLAVYMIFFQICKKRWETFEAMR